MSDLIVKDNALINASYNLALVEQRLILLAIIEARESGKGINANDPLSIHAESYVNQFKVDRTVAYKSLKSACKDLFDRQFSYQSTSEKGNEQKHKSRWVSEIIYVEKEAVVKLIFAPAIIPFITRLEKQFTKYDIEQISSLSSAYAVRMYELLICWRSTGKTPIIELSEFRNKMGLLEHEYQRLDVFKKGILELAIKQINKYTDIKVSYEQHKKGRVITGFSFSFKQKPQQKKEKTVSRDKDTIDMFFDMTESQLDMFSSKLSELSEVGGMAHVGEDMKQFIARLRSMLQDKEQQKKLAPFLAKVGYR